MQLENLRTHPYVRAPVSHGGLHLHGWVYKIETGQVFAYNSTSGQFEPLEPVEEPAVGVGVSPGYPAI